MSALYLNPDLQFQTSLASTCVFYCGRRCCDDAIPVDCVWGGWTEWSTCTATSAAFPGYHPHKALTQKVKRKSRRNDFGKRQKVARERIRFSERPRRNRVLELGFEHREALEQKGARPSTAPPEVRRRRALAAARAGDAAPERWGVVRGCDGSGGAPSEAEGARG